MSNDAEVDRIMSLSDEELLAEMKERGLDPKEVADRGRAAFRRALAQVEAEDLQEDLGQMLEALGMSDHARPYSPHHVFQEALTEMKRQLAAGQRSAASTVEPVADSYLAERKKVVYQKLAEEGGGTWATYMMMDIEEAFAAPATSPEPTERIPKVRTSHNRNKEEAARLQKLVDAKFASPVPSGSPDAADVKQKALDWCKANIVSASDPSKPADCTVPCNACMTMAHGCCDQPPEPDAVREALAQSLYEKYCEKRGQDASWHDEDKLERDEWLSYADAAIAALSRLAHGG